MGSRKARAATPKLGSAGGSLGFPPATAVNGPIGSAGGVRVGVGTSSPSSLDGFVRVGQTSAAASFVLLGASLGGPRRPIKREGRIVTAALHPSPPAPARSGPTAREVVVFAIFCQGITGNGTPTLHVGHRRAVCGIGRRRATSVCRLCRLSIVSRCGTCRRCKRPGATCLSPKVASASTNGTFGAASSGACPSRLGGPTVRVGTSLTSTLAVTDVVFDASRCPTP